MDANQKLHQIYARGEEFKVQSKVGNKLVQFRAKMNESPATDPNNVKGKWGVWLTAQVFEHANTNIKSNAVKDVKGRLENCRRVIREWENKGKPKEYFVAHQGVVSHLIRAANAQRLDEYVFEYIEIGVNGKYVNLKKEAASPPKAKPGSDSIETDIRDHIQSQLIQLSRNIVLEGVPGTGKTHAINALNVAYDGDAKPVPGTGISELRSATGRPLPPAPGTQFVPVEVRFMTMHPSTSYEDFVEGLRPSGAWTNAKAAKKVTDGKSADPQPGPWFHEETSSPTTDFALKNGFFVEACVAAVADPNKAVVVVLDELNRCNIPKVLGDLMTVIEESKRAHWNGTAWVVDSDSKAVTLPYSGRKLFVPDNLFIVGTMNTTDRSVAPMDAALRRRFSFHRIWPDGFSASTPKPKLTDLSKELQELAIAPHTELWLALNQVLLAKFGADAMLGHSYLYDLRTALSQKEINADEVVAYHWNYRILPQLMDVIASNGLTRSFVVNPRKFFGEDGAPDLTKAGTVGVFKDQLTVTISGEGSLRSAEIRWPATP